LTQRDACTRFAAAGNIGPHLRRFLEGEAEVQSIEHVQAIGQVWPEAIKGIACPECHQALAQHTPSLCRIARMGGLRMIDRGH